MQSSAVILKDVSKNWRDANETCQLINFSQVRKRYTNFKPEMNVDTSFDSGYWIQDVVTEFSIVNKGINRLLICIIYNEILKETTYILTILTNIFFYETEDSNSLQRYSLVYIFS